MVFTSALSIDIIYCSKDWMYIGSHKEGSAKHWDNVDHVHQNTKHIAMWNPFLAFDKFAWSYTQWKNISELHVY